MGKRSLNKGYTLIEMLVVLALISIFSLLTLNKSLDIDEAYYEFFDEYNLYKSIALKDSNKTYYDYDIYFNEDANVNRARTITFDNGKSIIVELGFGVLKYE